MLARHDNRAARVSICSYAQNFEDVMLWRALKHVENGRYVDIGAWHPVHDSVSKGFYELGWRGVHVEPTAYYSHLLRADRPDEIVINAAASNVSKPLKFYEIPDTGMSTCSGEIAESLVARGWRCHETAIPALTLDQIFDVSTGSEIHWLKIDVEGHEQAVIEGWKSAVCRPWVVVVEAIDVLSRERSDSGWDGMLLEKGYSFVYFDGVNRFYIARDHAELSRAFTWGPCLWDEFQLPAEHRSVRSLVAVHTKSIEEVRLQMQESVTEAIESVSRLEAANVRLGAGMATLSGVLLETRKELSDARDELHQWREANLKLGRKLDQTERDAARFARQLGEARIGLEKAAADRDAAKLQLAELSREHEQTRQMVADTRDQLAAARAATDQAAREFEGEAQSWSKEGAQLRAELERVTGSFWWRITGPFREAFRVGVTKSIAGDDASDRVPKSMDELLSLHDEAFVRAGYRALLGREPDSDGLRHWLARVRQGDSRLSVMAAIHLSPEGHRHQPKLRGLRSAMRHYRWMHSVMLGPSLQMIWTRARAQETSRRLASAMAGLKALDECATASAVEAPTEEAFAEESSCERLVVTPDPDGATSTEPALIAGPTMESGAQNARLRWTVCHSGEFHCRASHGALMLARALRDLGQSVEDESCPERSDVTVLFEPPSDMGRTAQPRVLLLQEWRGITRSQDWLDRVNAMDAVGCATRQALKELVDEGVQVPISVVGRGVDHWIHIDTKRRFLPSTKRFRFVHVSDGRPERGVDILLDAFGRVFDRNDDASLLICLCSPSREKGFLMRLEALRIANADYPEVTIVDEALDDEELKSLVAQCHVYVSPSRLEEFGSGVALAFLCGLPAIVTGWGGQLDYCDSTNSWLLDYDFRYATALSNLGTLAWAEPSTAELESALWSAYRSTPGDRASMAEAGRKTLMANFTWRHVAERMLKLAASALLARGGAS